MNNNIAEPRKHLSKDILMNGTCGRKDCWCAAPEPITASNPDIRDIAFDFVGDLGLPEHRSKEWLGARTERLIQRIVSVVNKYRVGPG